MPAQSIILIHPPVAKPSEPPAGVARLAGAMRAHGRSCTLIDANIEGLLYLARNGDKTEDTWTRRAHRHLERHLAALRTDVTYHQPDPYRRAVADINRLLDRAGHANGIKVGLANYVDAHLSPVRSHDLIQAAQQPERNPFYTYFKDRLLVRIGRKSPDQVGISINFLSQALCAFALIGMLRRTYPDLKIMVGGGLATSWLQQSDIADKFYGWVDHMVSGPGEPALLGAAGCQEQTTHCLPDYQDLRKHAYLSPGWVLPFSASRGCWWRRCAFCPERAEGLPFVPVPHAKAVGQLKQLCRQQHPVLIHLLDNAISPALLKALVKNPPGVPWYGFVRIAAPLDEPVFCRQLKASGCAMLKIGLESGDPKVLAALEKGTDLAVASKVLANLKAAGIATYVYLLFGTPAEDETAANNTLSFVSQHSDTISFLNLALFNLPVASHQINTLEHNAFYQGDLALYREFSHPKSWDRPQVRRFVEKRFKKHPRIQPIIRKDPPIFTSNHAAFMTFGSDG